MFIQIVSVYLYVRNTQNGFCDDRVLWNNVEPFYQYIFQLWNNLRNPSYHKEVGI